MPVPPQIGSRRRLESYQAYCICQMLDIPFIDIQVANSSLHLTLVIIIITLQGVTENKANNALIQIYPDNHLINKVNIIIINQILYTYKYFHSPLAVPWDSHFWVHHRKHTTVALDQTTKTTITMPCNYSLSTFFLTINQEYSQILSAVCPRGGSLIQYK